MKKLLLALTALLLVLGMAPNTLVSGQEEVPELQVQQNKQAGPAIQVSDHNSNALYYNFRRSWGGEGEVLGLPGDVIVNNNNELLIVDSVPDRIVAVDLSDRTARVIQNPQTKDYLFNIVNNIYQDSNNNIYLTNGFSHTVQLFTENWVLISEWGGNGSDNGQFNNPSGVTTDRFGRIFIADQENHRIQVFDSNGNFEYTFGSYGSGNGQFKYPSGLVIGTNDFIYVVDHGNSRIQKFNLNGGYQSQWGSLGTANSQFDSPIDIALDDSNNLYVTDSLNDRIQVFDQNGKFLRKWGELGDCEGCFWRPDGITVKGNVVYVVDRCNRRLQLFDLMGNFILQWGQKSQDSGQFDRVTNLTMGSDGILYTVDFNSGYLQKFNQYGSLLDQWWVGGNPRSIKVGPDNLLYVLTSLYSKVKVLDTYGNLQTEWGESGSGEGQLLNPQGLAFDSETNIYIADTWNNRISKFTKNGTFINSWGSEGGGIGEFNDPQDVAVDSIGNILVVESSNNRVQVFNKDFEFQQFLYGLGNWNGPNNLFIDSADNIYVADSGNNRIQKFSSEFDYDGEFGSFGAMVYRLNYPYSIFVTDSGSLFIAEMSNKRISQYDLNLPTPDSYSGLVQNGSFEKSPALMEWTHGGNLPVSRSTISLNGSYAIRLGEPVAQAEQGIGEAWAYSNFYVDPNLTRPTLSFKYSMFVNDIVDYSDFFVAIQDGAGLNHLATVVRDGFRPCTPGVPPASGQDLDWRTITYDLSAYKGQHIRVHFSNRNLWPGSWGIWTNVDDVKVLDAGPLPIAGPYAVNLPVVRSYTCDVRLLNQDDDCVLYRKITPIIN